MSVPREISGWSLHAQAVAWFQAWLRAVRSGDTRLAALATAELYALGVEVRPTQEVPPNSTRCAKGT